MSIARSTTAVTICCNRCGNALNAVAASVRCPACGNQQMLDPQQLAALTQYQQEVQGFEQVAQYQLADVAQLEVLHAGHGVASRNTFLIAVLCMSAPLVLAFAFAVIGIALGLSRDVVQHVASIIAMAGSCVGLGGCLTWYYSGARRVIHVARPTHAAICPSCGAPTAFSPGQIIETCRFCGSSAAPGTAVRSAGIEAAAQAARLSRFERYRAERRAMAGYSNTTSSAMKIAPWMTGFWLGAMVVGSAIYATVSALSGTDPAPIYVIAIIWLGSVALALTGIRYLTTTSKKRDLWRTVHDRLAADLNGVAVAGVDAVASWLNTFWPCPFPLENLYLGRFSGSVLGQSRGYPVLLVLNPWTASDGLTPNASVLVAARFGGRNDDEELTLLPEFQALHNRLARAGYSLKIYGGGLYVAATSAVLDKLAAQPTNAMALLSAAQDLAHHASDAGAQATTPLPELG